MRQIELFQVENFNNMKLNDRHILYEKIMFGVSSKLLQVSEDETLDTTMSTYPH